MEVTAAPLTDLPVFLKPIHELLARAMTDDPRLTKTDLHELFVQHFPHVDLFFNDALHIDYHLFGPRKARRWRNAYDLPEENDTVKNAGIAKNVGVFTFDLELFSS